MRMINERPSGEVPILRSAQFCSRRHFAAANFRTTLLGHDQTLYGQRYTFRRVFDKAGPGSWPSCRDSDYGTLAHITDFDLLDDGLLGIEARGGERFEVVSSEVRDDQLIHAQIAPFQQEEPASIPEELHHLGRSRKRCLSMSRTTKR